MPKKPHNYVRGDLFILPNGHSCMVLDLDEYGWPTRLMSLEPDDELGKQGWYLDGEDWIMEERDLLKNMN